MKSQALFSLKDKSEKLKCRLLQFLFGALRVKRMIKMSVSFVVVVVLLFYVHGKHLRSCRDGQLT